MIRDGVTIAVQGVPVPKGRPRFARAGQFVRTFTPKKTGDYEALVRARAIDAMGGDAPFVGPLTARVVVSLPVPQSWSQKKRSAARLGNVRPIARPDLDNFIKVIDALNGVVFADDSQIVEIVARKEYGEPGLVISIDCIAIARAA